jgi:hypothetical protein
LPTEILIEILSYLPDQLTVGQTCTKFYDISCEIKKFTLQLKSSALLEDDATFESMMSSKRRIRTIFLTGKKWDYENWIDLNLQRISEVLSHFGGEVEKMKLMDARISVGVLSLLSLMPNLHKLTLRRIKSDGKLPDNFSLNLPNLREMRILKIPRNFFEAFNRLPADVLHKVCLSIPIHVSNGIKHDDKFFENQRNIKEIHSFGFSVSFLHMQQLKLTTLRLEQYSDSLNRLRTSIESFIIGQDTLTSFTLKHTSLSQNDLTTICSELKSLVKLDIFVDKSLEFQQISKLQKLTELKINFFRRSFEAVNPMCSIQSKSLQDLSFNSQMFISEGTMIQLSLNCRNLRALDMHTASPLTLLNPILLHFPQLEKLSFSNTNISNRETNNNAAISDGFEHLNLKRLHLGDYQKLDEMLKLVGFCKNLQAFSTSMNFTGKPMKDLFCVQPNLKSLCLKKSSVISQELVAAINFGKNLESFHCSYETRNLKLDDSITEDTLKKEFKDQFKGIGYERVEKRIGTMKVVNYNLMMKKSKVTRDCCETD